MLTWVCANVFTDCILKKRAKFYKFKDGKFSKKRKIRNAYRGYATKELQTIETVIEESENNNNNNNNNNKMLILGTLTEEILGLR